MPTYEAWLPTWASVRVVLETEDEITDPEELRRRMLDEGASQACLCHGCANDVEVEEVGFDMDESARSLANNPDAIQRVD